MNTNFVPDQPLDPPEPSTRPTYWEILERNQDYLIDEAKIEDSNWNSKN